MPNPPTRTINLSGTHLSLTCPTCGHTLLGTRAMLRDFQRSAKFCPSCTIDLSKIHDFEKVTIG